MKGPQYSSVLFEVAASCRKLEVLHDLVFKREAVLGRLY
jgi:hypothetical protein